jgi:transcriptional regulator with XRE-family HTH domain
MGGWTVFEAPRSKRPARDCLRAGFGYCQRPDSGRIGDPPIRMRPERWTFRPLLARCPLNREHNATQQYRCRPLPVQPKGPVPTLGVVETVPGRCRALMDDPTTVGARVKVLRRWRKMSQQTVAGLAGFSQQFLSEVERGQMALDRRSHIAGLARALRVSETDIVGGPHLSADPMQSDPHAGIPDLEIALSTNTLRSPITDNARSLHEIAAEMSGKIEPLGGSADYIRLAKPLARVLDELHLHVASPVDEAAYARALKMLIEACLDARAMVHNLGYSSLAHLAANRAVEAAALLDDPGQQGKAEWGRIMSMPKAGGWDRTLIAAERAANDLEPHVRGPADIQVLGMLTLAASLSAAALFKDGMANHWLSEAAGLAERIPDEPAKNWRHFSATNVNMWRVTIGFELGEKGGAILERANTVNFNLDDADQARTSHNRDAAFMAETGCGLARERKTRVDSVEWLRRAEDVAPQLIRNNARVRETVNVLDGQALPRAERLEVRGMMARMGIPH